MSERPVLLVRNSERQSFLTCRQQWHWGWVERWKPDETDVKLQFGDLIHQSLATYYKPGRKRGPHPAKTFERLVEKQLDEWGTKIWSDGEYEDLATLGIGMLNAYVPFANNHPQYPDVEYEVIASEHTFQVPVGIVRGYRVIVVGTIDGVWRHIPTKRIRFVEHKTATAITKDMLPMDDQIGTYWTFGPRYLRKLGILTDDQNLDGILYNWLRKAIKKPEDDYDGAGRKLNADGSISKRQPPPFFDRALTFRGKAEARAVRRRVRCEARDMILARERPDLHIYKNPGMQFMPNCKFCPFRDPCELHETGNDYQSMFEIAYKRWEPYAEHELAERR
jgi:hypothetical protein